MNEAILLMLLLIILLVIFVLYKVFEKQGFIYSLMILNIMAYIMSFKTSPIFNSNINIGIIPLTGIFTVIYLYLIKYGKKEYNEIYITTIYVNVFMVVFTLLVNYFIPSITDNTAINMTDTFIDNYKIIIAYPIMILLSEYVVYRLYNLLKLIKTNQQLIIILLYIITSLLYTILYNIIINIKLLTIKESVFLGVSTYILGLIITIFTTIYIYIFTKKKVKK